jgi:ribosomal-protein-alanine N-acetyltransferase
VRSAPVIAATATYTLFRQNANQYAGLRVDRPQAFSFPDFKQNRNPAIHRGYALRRPAYEIPKLIPLQGPQPASCCKNVRAMVEYAVPIPTLRGQLITLRKLVSSDAASIRLNADDPQIARYMPRLPHPYSIYEARKWIVTTHRLARQDKAYNFGIEDQKSGRIVGMIGLRNINRQDKNAEVGYWVGRSYQGRRYATEALRLILGFAFGRLRLVRVYAVVHQQNIASFRLLEKSGFVREGIWRKASFINRRWRDVYSYGILKEEFAAIKRS